ncbi:nucleotidyltransferase domain-containing protein [Bacillus mangrovi]|uniref:Nucleotidyltransferase domain-containing protein n=1 Tax=Metabacillus mangrovi TaxID=1491830 RepID=A0A7X2V5M3_9BACI|nr:nucleotidyltransferase domain-containing protein [Metabacillus mangrovi]MTH54957.1 nucleotidyltransferase domain-containing protein [Metabacillus mangrovi]
MVFMKEKINPYLIVLFGSAAKGTDRKDSDYDLAYLSDQVLGMYDRFMLAQELAAIVNRDVDLIDLKEATTVFAAQVVGTGQTIYCNDEKRRAIFEMKTLKMYARLNEERAIVLKRIRESGSVYE